jgi:predicted transcriptional regulator YdeE
MFICKIEKNSETPKSWDYSVAIKTDSEDKYSYTVTVEKDHYYALTNKKISALKLVEQTFFFLHEREPFSAILSDFNLKEVTRYFPDYEQEIRKAL